MSLPELPHNSSRREMRKALIRLGTSLAPLIKLVMQSSSKR